MPLPANSVADEIMHVGQKTPTLKMRDPGDSVWGEIVKIDKAQQTDYDTGKALYWENNVKVDYDTGDPVLQYVITVRRPDLSEGPDDDGTRNIWLPTRNDIRTGIANAVRAAGGERPEPGDIIKITHTGVGGKNGKMKLYEFQYKTGAGPAASEFTAPPAPAAGPADVSPADLERALAALKQQGLTSDATQPPF